MMQAGARLAWLWDVFFGTHLDPSEFTFPHPFRQDSNFRLEEKTAAMIPLTDPETGKDVTVMFAYIPDILCGGNFSVLHTMSEEEIPSNPGAVTAFDFKTSLPYATADPMADLTASLQRTVAIEHNLHSPVGANFVGCRNGRRSWSPMDFCDPEDAASRAGTVVYTNISPRQTPDGRNVFENCTMTVPGHLDFSPESPYHKAIAHIASRLGDPRRNTPTRKRPKLITPDIRGPDYQPVLPGF